MSSSNDIYQTVTNQIVKALEQGVAPWIKPWRPGEPTVPINAASGRAYNGINIPLLWMSAMDQGFPCDRWLTFKQVLENGGCVRKGEQSTSAVLYRPMEKEELDHAGNPVMDAEGQPKLRRFAILREFRLFNLTQCEGLPESLSAPVPAIADPISAADLIIQRSEVRITHLKRDKACYSPGRDRITLPFPEQFDNTHGYYATLLHELTHATGHISRLAREGIVSSSHTFGDPVYAFEELVAEMGSAFLCAHVGIQGQLQHSSYIASWLNVLRRDKRAIFRASGQARQACEYLQELASVTAVSAA